MTSGEQLELGRVEPPVYQVGDLVRLASRRLESRFADVWVEGEVSNLKTPSSGHLYFTLKDRRAQLQVVVFRSAARRLRFRVEDGLQLRCRGALGIYEVQGRFQLNASSAEPAGLGALQLQVDQLKEKLSREGLFDVRHKRPIPRLPRTIAVVTSPSGAALKDILKVLSVRCPVQVVVCPAQVQGAEAPSQITRSLRQADGLGADLIIVGRGGGSLEDLMAFNNEGVARAIFALKTPVISAVGHEVDLTIADLVADSRAPTPSAAAELAVPVMTDLAQQLDGLCGRLRRGMEHTLQHSALRLAQTRHQLQTPVGRLQRHRQQLDDQAEACRNAVTTLLRVRQAGLQRLRQRLAAQEPRVRCARSRAQLELQQRRLAESARRRLQDWRAGLQELTARLEGRGPAAALERGFALALDEKGALMREVGPVRVGQAVQLKLRDGTLWCRVERISPKEPPT